MEYNISNEVVKISTEMQNELYVRTSISGFILQIPDIFDKWYTSQYDCDSVYKNAVNVWNKTIEPIIKKGVEMLSAQGVYSIDEKIFVDKYLTESCFAFFDELDIMQDRVAIINGLKQAEKDFRQDRKQSRGRVVGGGFGFSGAIKGMATAGAMNATTGMVHSLGNALGNMGSSINACHSKSEIYKESRKPLKEALVQCAFEIQDGIRNALEREAGIRCKYITLTDINQAEAIVKNYKEGRIPDEQKIKQLILALSLNPYSEEIYDIIWKNYGDKNGDLRKMSAYFGTSLEQRIRKKAEEYGKTLFWQNCSTYENAYDKQRAAINCEQQIRLTLAELIKYCKECDVPEKSIPVIEKCRQLLNDIDFNLRTVHGVTYKTREIAKSVESDYKTFYDALAGKDIFAEQTYGYVLAKKYYTSEFINVLNSLFGREEKLRNPQDIYKNIFDFINNNQNKDFAFSKWIEIPNFMGDLCAKESLIRTITEMSVEEVPLILFARSLNGKSGILITNLGLRVYSKGLLSNSNQFYPIEQIEAFECTGLDEYAVHIYKQNIVTISFRQKEMVDGNQIIFSKTISKIIRLVNNLFPEDRKNLYRILNSTITCECGMRLLPTEIICPSCKKMRKANGEFVETQICPSCNNTIQAGKKFCSNCGSQLIEGLINDINLKDETISSCEVKETNSGMLSDNCNEKSEEALLVNYLICKKCGNKIQEGKKFCSKCGSSINLNIIVNSVEIEEDKIRCPSCHNLIKKGKKFCMFCGTQLQ